MILLLSFLNKKIKSKMPVQTRSLSKDNISHIGYKLVFVSGCGETKNDIFGIAQLGIAEFGKNNEHRSVDNSLFAKYRCDRAYVKKITSLDGKKEYPLGYSVFRSGGYYYTGHWIRADNYDEDKNEVCAAGIHYYLSRDAVINLFLTKYHNRFQITISGELIQLYNPYSEYITIIDDNGKTHMKIVYNSNHKFVEKIEYYMDDKYCGDEELSIKKHGDIYHLYSFGQPFKTFSNNDFELSWN